MKKEFSTTLKDLRIRAGYTQKQVYEMLGIPQSTFSSWEIGKAEPPADTLLKLCQIYGVDDVLGAFGYDGYNDDGSLRLTITEAELIEKYRDLDDHGRETVNIIVDRELIRVAQLKEKSSAPDDAEDEYQMVARGGKVVKPNKPFDADTFKAALDGVEQTDNL